jgi:glucosamine--fructose-6-phosphate aminotransferase (isomerizing)
MCGIVGIISDNLNAKEIIECLGRLEYRGYDSAGLALVSDNNIVVKKNVGYVECLKLDEELSGNVGIGHVRWATHGGVTELNAHPHIDCKNEYAIVHNGIIENYAELRSELIKAGHIFKSDTDSEVIAHLIEKYSSSGFKAAFEKAISMLKGSYAIVALSCKENYLMVARKDSPLMICEARNKVYVVSDIVAVEDIEKIHEVIEGIASVVSLDIKDNEISIPKVEFGGNGKCGYPHYMLKEINEQPITFQEALKQDKDKLIGVAFDILRARDVILTACGTSRFASIVGRYLMSRLANKFSEVIVGSEAHYFSNSFNDSTLLLAVSQSGETADVLSGVNLAKKRGSKIVSIVNKPYSSLERISDVTLFLNCGAEISVASTKAFTNELAIFYLLAYTMANKYDNGLIELMGIPEKINQCLAQNDKAKEVAERIKNAEHIYYIGKGINFAVSGECSLKLKEVSYIHAESMSAGELKHGTLALVDKGTPIIGLCPDDYTYQETIANMHEAKVRNALIIGISDKYNEVFDYWLPIPKVKDIYYPLVSTIIGQLLAYYVAVFRGLNVDRPRNLAKSVTVI